MNIKDWCESNLESIKIKGSECVAKCPFCERDERQFSVNIKTGAYQCLRAQCGNKGKKIKYLIAYVECLTYEQVENKYDLAESSNTIKLASNLFGSVKDSSNNIDFPYESIELTNNHDNNKFYSYLINRGISEQTINDIKFRYCNVGKYSNRVIIPINTLGFSGFTSRTIDPNEKQRYKNEPGDWKHSALVGLNLSIQNRDLSQFIICEGPFDFISLYDKGFASVAIQGTNLTLEQCLIIKKTIPNTSSIIIMLDPEVSNKIINNIASLIYDIGGFRNILIAKLQQSDSKIDPGNATKQQINQALINSKLWQGTL